MAWKIEFSRDAAKTLLRLPRDQALRLRRSIDRLARDPYHAPNVRKLTQHPGFRMRVGDWRIVYLIDGERIVVQIVRIASRGDAYE